MERQRVQKKKGKRELFKYLLFYLVECYSDSIQHVCDRIHHVLMTNVIRLEGLFS